jgi:hypothetical protein
MNLMSLSFSGGFDMKNIFVTCLFILLILPVLAQKTFDLKDASKYFDIKVSVEECDQYSCVGQASFSFYKKGANTPYQVIKLPNTQIILDEKSKTEAQVTMIYANQSVVNVGDFNFDGLEDIAICDGPNGIYGEPAYQVYLSSRSTGKFVHSPAFSELGQYSGMFEVDKKKKTLQTMSKSGCCWHAVEEYQVIKNRPVKVFIEEEDLGFYDEKNNEGKTKITTKRLVKGKWQIRLRYVN